MLRDFTLYKDKMYSVTAFHWPAVKVRMVSVRHWEDTLTLGVSVCVCAHMRTFMRVHVVFFFLKDNFFFFKIYWLIDWLIDWLLCWVFVSVLGLSLVAASGGHSSSRCAGLSLLWPLLLQSTGSRRAGSVVVAHGPSRSAACVIFPDQGSNLCPLHWQADSQPLRHQGSLSACFFQQWLYIIV